MIRTFKRGKGTVWQVYAHRAGNKIYVGTYDSEAEAEQAERHFKRRVAQTVAHLDRAMASMLRHYASVLEERAKVRAGSHRSGRSDPRVLFDASDYLEGDE